MNWPVSGPNGHRVFGGAPHGNGVQTPRTPDTPATTPQPSPPLHPLSGDRPAATARAATHAPRSASPVRTASSLRTAEAADTQPPPALPLGTLGRLGALCDRVVALGRQVRQALLDAPPRVLQQMSPQQQEAVNTVAHWVGLQPAPPPLPPRFTEFASVRESVARATGTADEMRQRMQQDRMAAVLTETPSMQLLRELRQEVQEAARSLPDTLSMRARPAAGEARAAERREVRDRMSELARSMEQLRMECEATFGREDDRTLCVRLAETTAQAAATSTYFRLCAEKFGDKVYGALVSPIERLLTQRLAG